MSAKEPSAKEPDEVSPSVATLHAAIARLARDMHGSSEVSVAPDDVLVQVTQAAVDLIPGVDHAGVTLVRRRHRSTPPELESTAETGPIPRQIDDLQHHFGDGPCFEAIWTEETVYVPDVLTETRWPAFVRAIGEQTPVRSSLAIQLVVNDVELGALNLHSEKPEAFDEAVTEVAMGLAAHAAIALSGARRGQQFRVALASRDIIGQAKGMIMERYDTDAGRAFGILRQLSQESNVPIVDVARRIVEADHPE